MTTTINANTQAGATTSASTETSHKTTSGAKGSTITWARPHRDTAGSTPMSGVYGDLVEDWKRVCELPTVRTTLRKWAKAHPALGGFDSLTDLLDEIDSAGAERTDELLSALIQLAQAGQQLAGQTVLQAMLPKLSRMAATATMDTGDANTPEERRQIGVTTFWDLLATYPAERRTRRVAANLALDTLHQITAPTRRAAAEYPQGLGQDLYGHPTHSPGESIFGHEDISPSLHRGHSEGTLQAAAVDETSATAIARVSDGPDTDGDLLSCVAWGVDVSAITAEEASMLVRVYAPAPDQAGGHRTVAADLGIREEALRARCSRAVRRLTVAVRQHTEGDPFLTAA